MMKPDKETNTKNRLFSDFELYWPYGNRVSRLIEGGEIGAINGFIHLVDNVLIQPEDLRAAGTLNAADSFTIILSSLIAALNNHWRGR